MSHIQFYYVTSYIILSTLNLGFSDITSIHIYCKLLDDIDASTFRQIDNGTFEDKDYIYTIKEKAWGEEYPFVKKKKNRR